MRPEVLDSLTFEPAYWLTQISKDELGKESNYRLRPVRDAASYDVFGTANFFNFMPLAASIGTLLGVGIDEIARYNDALVDRLVSGLDDERFDLVSPVSGQQRSTLVLIQPRDRSKSRVVHETLAANGVDVALRGDKIRFSPHVYNTEDDIDRALAVLDQAGR
jgi:selenocysteine lyase/cysteine desulfurase